MSSDSVSTMGYYREKDVPKWMERQAKYLSEEQPENVLKGIQRWVERETAMMLEENDLKKAKLGSVLGKGSFSKVLLGLLESGTYVAVKQVSLNNADGEIDIEEEVEKIQLEVKLMKTVIHPNIVQCYGSIFNPEQQTFEIYMEYIGGRTLADMTRNFHGLPPKVVNDYSRQIITGVAVLHEANICHRDIKPENILVNLQQQLLKLCDFGCSKQIDKIKSGKANKSCATVAGTPYYMSPEILTDDVGYDGMRADIWSIGATVIQMATGDLPWPKSSSDVAAIFMISQAQGPPTLCPDSSEIGSPCYNFISCCCAIDPHDRPTAEELLCHPYIAP